jgi:uncharacterized membrane protein (UPF0127 family)
VVIRIQSSGKVVTKDAKMVTSFKEMSLGLLDKASPSSLIFNTRWGLHTLGMKHPIDVIVLDSSGKIVRLKSLKPNRIFTWNPKYSQAIEFPQGTIKKINLKKGDYLEIS